MTLTDLWSWFLLLKSSFSAFFVLLAFLAMNSLRVVDTARISSVVKVEDPEAHSSSLAVPPEQKVTKILLW